ncbi:methylisocitrate lyase [Nocardioides sp. GY 10113]|uniref:isocitrate lyase/PEP mutase family protein n=1 Tax=Nocardioides sp. GY 10113 TaxID=2569761 RepID=UPI0010A7B3FC|nr:isocitrate lyase/phosphoenolpyruvate mutase family protein [Nocardioides sp. GY 10113]TIC88039.1 methylisocitrate lyase [Nocardioides sp. GY 10113]
MSAAPRPDDPTTSDPTVPTGTGPQRLRALLGGTTPARLPGVFDAVSAAIAAAAGAPAVCLSGATVSAVDLGLPDLGFVHGTDIARRAASLRGPLAGVPVLADADTGYGNALQAAHTAREYAAAGIAGLHLEDQVAPKRCGHLGGKEVVGLDEAAGRVRAAVEADTGLVVVARTDALSVLGREAVVQRCRAFAEAGADAVFVEGAGLGDLAAVAAALTADGRPVPQVYNRSEAGGPVEAGPDDAALAAVGVRLVIHPVSALLAAAAAVRRAVVAVLEGGHAAPVERIGWGELTGLVGLPELLAAEQTYAAAGAGASHPGR